MEVFHVGDKVFLDDVKDFEDFEYGKMEYGKIKAIDKECNLMVISPIINGRMDWWIIKVDIDSPYVHKIDFLPNDHVIIHDLLKDHCNKKGIVDAYDRTIDRYRVMIDNDSEPHWFAPFELTLENNLEDDNDKNEHFIASFSTFNPIKVTLSDEGKKAYEYHFGAKPPVDAQGRTEFTNLAYLMEVYDSTFIYGDKRMLEDDEILVKEMD